jgi:hypothetical protein
MDALKSGMGPNEAKLTTEADSTNQRNLEKLSSDSPRFNVKGKEHFSGSS